MPKVGKSPVKAIQSGRKVMATVFCDAKGISLVDFLVGKKTVAYVYYKSVLRKLAKNLLK